MANPITQRFIQWYAARQMAKANRNRDKIRQAQAESGRTEKVVQRYEVYSEDVRHRTDWQQDIYVFTVVVDDGRVVPLANNTRPDVTIRTDVPVVQGLASGHFTAKVGGAVKVYDNFTPWDAVRLGRLESDGKVLLMRNLYLLDKVMPDLAHELRI